MIKNKDKEKAKLIGKLVKCFPMGGGVKYFVGIPHGYSDFKESQLKIFEEMILKILQGGALAKCFDCGGNGATVKKYDSLPLLNKYTYQTCESCSGTGFIIVYDGE